VGLADETDATSDQHEQGHIAEQSTVRQGSWTSTRPAPRRARAFLYSVADALYEPLGVVNASSTCARIATRPTGKLSPSRSTAGRGELEDDCPREQEPIENATLVAGRSPSTAWSMLQAWSICSTSMDPRGDDLDAELGAVTAPSALRSPGDLYSFTSPLRPATVFRSICTRERQRPSSRHT